MKDIDYTINKEFKEELYKFEISDKIIIYFLLPWYKPPSHSITQYPFMIIAYFWGIKPNKVNHKYSFNSIFEYFLKYDDNDDNFYFRKSSNNDLNIKGKYGFDEIVLTDHIISTFSLSETYILAQKNDINNLLLLYIIMINNDNNNKLLDILDE